MSAARSTSGVSPFLAEPPRRHLVVDAAMTLNAGRHGRQVASPHLHGGDDEAKARYEWEAAHELWVTVAPHAELADLRGRDVLDVGCGWGGKALRYAAEGDVRSMTGIDLPGVYDPHVPRRLAASLHLTNCRFVEGHAECMPIETGAFDVCIMDDVMEHVSDPARVLNECARVLRPRGILVVKFPSIRMIRAHHLDRAVAVPGLHYVLSLRTWAAGLNDWRRRHPDRAFFDPFDEAVRSKFSRRWVTRNLNGLDLSVFGQLVSSVGFHTRHLGVATLPPTSFGLGPGGVERLYFGLARRQRLRELLGTSVVFVGVSFGA